MLSGKKPLFAVSLLVFLLIGNIAYSEKPMVWGELEPGKHAIGFKTVEEFDYSRIFRPKHDYLGNPVEGERHRPVQACIWYPAIADSNAIRMTYAEYAFPYPQDDRFFNLLSALQDREMQYLFQFTRDQEAVLRISSTEMGAVRDAAPAQGEFPLIIYVPDQMAGYAENAVMCEYLASHGYIILTTPSLGSTSANPAMESVDLENVIRDKEVALAMFKADDALSCSHIAVMGHGFGGLAALNLAMRNPDIEAVLTLQGIYTQAELIDFAHRSPSFASDRLTAPLMAIYTEATADQDLTLFNQLQFSDRISVGVPLFGGPEFAHYVMFSGNDPGAEQAQGVKTGHQEVCKITLAFFDANLKNHGELLPVLEKSSVYETMELASSSGNSLPPTQDQFVRILYDGNIDTAFAIYEKYHEIYPDRIFFPEGAVNMLGYRTLGTGRIDDAIRLFKMNTQAYPASANTWDSLSDGYLAAGETDKAAECMRKVLETLPTDTLANPQIREQIKTKCERFLDSLQQNPN